jgi:hypothetical protein
MRPAMTRHESNIQKPSELTPIKDQMEKVDLGNDNDPNNCDDDAELDY